MESIIIKGIKFYYEPNEIEMNEDVIRELEKYEQSELKVLRVVFDSMLGLFAY